MTSDAQTNESELPQLLDLKLQLAEALSANDTLRHQTTLLTKHNDRLTLEKTELSSDLDSAYEQITKLKKERDEAVRDLTRARMLQMQDATHKGLSHRTAYPLLKAPPSQPR